MHVQRYTTRAPRRLSLSIHTQNIRGSNAGHLNVEQQLPFAKND